MTWRYGPPKDDDGCLAMCLVIGGSLALLVGMLIYAAHRGHPPNATVRTPTRVYENCHVESVYRGTARLILEDGSLVTVVGCAEIEWHGGDRPAACE